MNKHVLRALSITLWVLTALSIGFALLMSLVVGLGSLGILADVSLDENRAMANEAVVYAGVAFGVGFVLLPCALLAQRAFRKCDL